jgi:hypothetical protein
MSDEQASLAMDSNELKDRLLQLRSQFDDLRRRL